MKVCRRVSLNAAHRLYRADWSDEKNLEVFGKCSNPNFHGHNYTIETWLDGPIDQETGYVIDLKILKDILYKEILHRFDHRNLNLDVPFMLGKMASTEILAIEIWKQIDEDIQKMGAQLHCITLVETENNYVEYFGGK